MNSLISSPDISKWNSKNIESMRGMFLSNTSLNYIPDNSKWVFSSIEDISYMLKFSAIKSLPDISKWNLKSNVKKIIYLTKKIQNIY